MREPIVPDGDMAIVLFSNQLLVKREPVSYGAYLRSLASHTVEYPPPPELSSDDKPFIVKSFTKSQRVNPPPPSAVNARSSSGHFWALRSSLAWYGG